MKAPAVTIVVPTCRRLHYLREALASARKQTFGDFELIVSDDGASDEVAGYVASLGDSRLRYRRNPRNLGIALNNLAAFSEAQGKYISSLHDDDLWEPEFLEKLVPPMETDDEIAVAFCDHHMIDEEGRLLPERTERSTRWFKRDSLRPGRHQPFLKEAVLDQMVPMAMGAVFRKSILHGAEYPRRIGGSYDHWLAYLAFRDGSACYYIPQRLTRYRVHESSGSSTRGAHNLLDAIYVRRRVLDDPQLDACRTMIGNGMGVLYGKMALFYLSRDSFWRGRVFLREAFRLMNRPKNIVALVFNAMAALLRGGPR